ncbi:thiamine phosphate synthase [Rheinheimera sp. MMS21-TC3]|uniref:thiamine phosphate synthase n=1 Tax=Rheinheimera sp. MMS21-TC3 TaxID=3072790 RepID=UPI0028C37781|nr:thiamine phosphate synthase [Rheinheimera sp. MMS21-TC3]WNO60832.1 thiamine phosphate synthase [Rheinheimera sp. MMS21-TC3]
MLDNTNAVASTEINTGPEPSSTESIIVESTIAKPIVWTLAGSDSGGGAGIQADLHTFKALDCHGCSVISCITAQNSLGITGYTNVSLALFISQLDCLIADMPPKVIKIGLIADPEQLIALTQWIGKNKYQFNFKVIADPVFSSSTGYDFAKQELVLAWQQLLPLIDLITPNYPELAILSQGKLITDKASWQSQQNTSTLEQQAKALLAQGVKAVLVTGGHDQSSNKVTDTLYRSRQAAFTVHNKRINTKHNHGTGCVLSSSISTALAHDYTVEDALIIGNACIQQGLAKAYATGKGAGCLSLDTWPKNREYFPQLRAICNKTQLQPYSSMQTPIGLYPVLDSCEWLALLAPHGLDTVQLRIKQDGKIKATETEIEQQIIAAVNLAKKYHLRLFINDYWQLAIKHGAYGVHLGQEDLLTADLVAINQAGLRLGISTHSYQEVLNAIELKPSYIALGHIYPTTTKDMPSKPQGLEKLKRYKQLCHPIPTVAIGGINATRLPQVLECQVDGVAVVTAITAQQEPTQAFIALKKLFSQYFQKQF